MSMIRRGLVNQRRRPSLRAIGIVVALALGIGACSQPYAWRSDENNRESPRFGKPLQEGEVVSVCYASGTSEADLQKVANARCAEIGRTATAVGSEFGRCPLLTPKEALYRCDDVPAN